MQEPSLTLLVHQNAELVSEGIVDEKAGLNGICDFLLGQSRQLYFVEAPIVAVVEAKKDCIPHGLGQCAATMVAVQRFNRKANKPQSSVYGCVTTGNLWRFLRLTAQQLDIDLDEYQIVQADRILGVLLHCCRVQNGWGFNRSGSCEFSQEKHGKIRAFSLDAAAFRRWNPTPTANAVKYFQAAFPNSLSRNNLCLRLAVSTFGLPALGLVLLFGRYRAFFKLFRPY